MRLVSCVLMMVIFTSQHVFAQDTPVEVRSSHVIKGVGAASCSNYTSSVLNEDEQRFIFGGFVQGYITGLNESLSEVFDLTPWQTETTFGRVLFNYCTNNPSQQFVFAVGRVLVSFNTDVLTKPSALQAIPNVTPTLLLREAVIIQMIGRLNSLGFGELNPNNGVTADVKQAISAFQKKEALEQTGNPDQETLLRLFVRDVESKK